MPEQDDETLKTYTESEYKSLQRKLNRRDAKAKGAEKDRAEMHSTIERLEELAANTLHALTLDDEARSELARRTLRDMSVRRPQDISAAQVGADVSQLLDEADTDWTDERLNEVRTLHDEVERTGDATMGAELVRKTREALLPAASSTSAEDIQRIVQEAILKDRQDHGRVDTGSSTSSNEHVRLADLRNLDPRKSSVKDMAEQAAQALDTFYNST
jgi:hypothetical protein